MKYYIIQQGEYSDRVILGVTKDQAKAIKYSKLNSTYDNPCFIEEYEELRITFDNSKEDFYYHVAFKDNVVISDECYCFNGRPDKQIIEYGKYYTVNVKAKNKNEAIKKASDVLAKYKALKIEYGKMIDDLVQSAKDNFDIHRFD